MRDRAHMHKNIAKSDISKMLLQSLGDIKARKNGCHELTKSDCKKLLDKLQEMRKTFIEMEEKGGFVLVQDQDTDAGITAYRFGSFRVSSAINKNSENYKRRVHV